MSRYIKVCTTVYYPITKPESGNAVKLNEKFKGYWKARLEQAIHDKPDIILLPEYCDRPVGIASGKECREYILEKGEEMLEFFKGMAKEYGCYIGYSSGRADKEGILFNSTQFIDRNGMVIGIYDKNYPTIGEMKNTGICPGKEELVVTCDFGRVGFAICWDLNFNEFRDRYSRRKADIMLFSSMFHGGYKSAVWAYECQAYFVGAIGGLGKQGYVLDPLGNMVAQTAEFFGTGVCDINLDYCVLQISQNKKALEAAKKKYGRKINIVLHTSIGALMLTSETDEFTAVDVVNEFELRTFPGLLTATREIRDSILTQEGDGNGIAKE